MWLQILIWIRSNYFPNGIKIFVPVSEIKLARCGVGTSKYYLADFEGSNTQFIQEKNKSVWYCDRIPVSGVARLFLWNEAFGLNLHPAARNLILVSEHIVVPFTHSIQI